MANMSKAKSGFNLGAAIIAGCSTGGSRTVTGMTADCVLLLAQHNVCSPVGATNAIDITASVAVGAGSVTITGSTSTAAKGAGQTVSLLWYNPAL